MRGVAQTISYEIRMALFLIRVLRVAGGLRWGALAEGSQEFSMLLGRAPALLGWLVCCVAESNRTPFDFAEGESELVSGFNVEYGGGPFAAIFMAEYASILALRALTASLAYRGVLRLLGGRAVAGLAVF